MIRKKMLMAILLIALIQASCATTTPYNPFKIGQDQFYSKINTIVIAPLDTPEDLEDPQLIKATFEPLIEKQMREAGFSIVPSSEYDEVWELMTKQMGGYFDPITGKQDESKFKAVRKHCLRELCTKFNANAILYPEIVIVSVRFFSNNASWHGTSESLLTGGFLKRFLTGQYQGNVPALSLLVTIKDIDDMDMYVNPGGIQLLSKLSMGKFLPVQRDQLFVNEERNIGAVNIALEPLIMESEMGKTKMR